VINSQKAAELGIKSRRPARGAFLRRHDKGPAVLSQGIRPDTLLMMGQFDHWATPYAKDMKAPSMNSLIPMSMGSPIHRLRSGLVRAGVALAGRDA